MQQTKNVITYRDCVQLQIVFVWSLTNLLFYDEFTMYVRELTFRKEIFDLVSFDTAFDLVHFQTHLHIYEAKHDETVLQILLEYL